LLKFPNQTPDIIEIAVTGVAIKHNWYIAGIRHEFYVLKHLGPAGLIAIPNAVLSRYC